MRICVRRLTGADLVILDGPLDLATLPRVRAVLQSRIDQGQTDLIVDLDRVTFAGAGAAGVFARLAERAEKAGGQLSAVGARGVSLDVLCIAGLDKRLSAYDEPSEILERHPGESEIDSYDQYSDLAGRWPGSRDITISALIGAIRSLPETARERTELRTQVIEDSMGLAQRLARRFRDRGEAIEDLTQVALVGLVNAVDGFDPARGEFVGYATPTIVGEIRRHFRDKGWRIRVPRRLQELRIQVNRATAELSQTMSGSPTVTDIARHLGIDPEDVEEAIEVARVYQPISLSAPGGTDGSSGASDPSSLQYTLGDEDPGMEAVEYRESVKPLLAALPERERRILAMRYFGEMTQAQIAGELGISQMHVSRLLTQTLQRLRLQLAEA